MGSTVNIPSGPGPRAAIGLLAPFDLELDAELWRWLPTDVDLLLSRTPFVDDDVTVEFVKGLSDDRDLIAGVRSLTAGRAEAVAYACTSASFVGGRDGEERIREAMIGAGASLAVTASGAIVSALAELGATRVSVATPYLPEVSAYFDGFLLDCGVEVLRHETLGLDRRIWEVPYARTADLIRAVDHPDAQAIIVSCTNLPTYDLIAPLERELGKPVVSANQATVWAVLRAIGRSAVGPGQTLIAH